MAFDHALIKQTLCPVVLQLIRQANTARFSDAATVFADLMTLQFPDGTLDSLMAHTDWDDLDQTKSEPCVYITALALLQGNIDYSAIQGRERFLQTLSGLLAVIWNVPETLTKHRQVFGLDNVKQTSWRSILYLVTERHLLTLQIAAWAEIVQRQLNLAIPSLSSYSQDSADDRQRIVATKFFVSDTRKEIQSDAQWLYQRLQKNHQDCITLCQQPELQSDIARVVKKLLAGNAIYFVSVKAALGIDDTVWNTTQHAVVPT